MSPLSSHPPEKFLSLADMMDITERDLEQRKKYLEFGPEDEERLRKLAALAENNADSIIEAFYDHLLQFEEMKAFFPDSATLNRVKARQKEYFVRLMQGDYDMDYVENRLRIGAVHEQIDLPVNHYLAMYNFYLRIAGKMILDNSDGAPENATAAYISLIKLTFLDISLAIETYIHTRERTIKALQQEAIRELSTPVLSFREGMLLLPIIGTIDSQRARQLTEDLLQAIRANRAKVIVIDITGVASVDSRVANHLLQTVEAARLMGAEVVISGISPEIALTMVTLGIDLEPVQTVGDLQNGIEHAERLLGYQVKKITEREDADDEDVTPWKFRS